MKDEQRKKRRKKRINPFLVIFVLVLLIVGLLIFSHTSFFEVKQFEVEGNAYYTDNEILLMGGCETGKNLFWGIDSKKIRSRLQQDAYMERVEVRRTQPSPTVTGMSSSTQRGSYCARQAWIPR